MSSWVWIAPVALGAITASFAMTASRIMQREEQALRRATVAVRSTRSAVDDVERARQGTARLLQHCNRW